MGGEDFVADTSDLFTEAATHFTVEQLIGGLIFGVGSGAISTIGYRAHKFNTNKKYRQQIHEKEKTGNETTSEKLVIYSAPHLKKITTAISQVGDTIDMAVNDSKKTLSSMLNIPQNPQKPGKKGDSKKPGETIPIELPRMDPKYLNHTKKYECVRDTNFSSSKEDIIFKLSFKSNISYMTDCFTIDINKSTNTGHIYDKIVDLSAFGIIHDLSCDITYKFNKDSKDNKNNIIYVYPYINGIYHSPKDNKLITLDNKNLKNKRLINIKHTTPIEMVYFRFVFTPKPEYKYDIK